MKSINAWTWGEDRRGWAGGSWIGLFGLQIEEVGAQNWCGQPSHYRFKNKIRK